MDISVIVKSWDMPYVGPVFQIIINHIFFFGERDCLTPFSCFLNLSYHHMIRDLVLNQWLHCLMLTEMWMSFPPCSLPLSPCILYFWFRKKKKFLEKQKWVKKKVRWIVRAWIRVGRRLLICLLLHIRGIEFGAWPGKKDILLHFLTLRISSFLAIPSVP